MLQVLQEPLSINIRLEVSVLVELTSGQTTNLVEKKKIKVNSNLNKDERQQFCVTIEARFT